MSRCNYRVVAVGMLSRLETEPIGANEGLSPTATGTHPPGRPIRVRLVGRKLLRSCLLQPFRLPVRNGQLVFRQLIELSAELVRAEQFDFVPSSAVL